MKVEGRTAVRAEPRRRRYGIEAGLVGVAAIAGLAAAAPAAAPAAGKNPAVTFESIPGSTAKRVILTAKAAERLGIETGKVSEEPVIRRQMVSGLVVGPMDGPPESKHAGAEPGSFAPPASAPKAARGGVGAFGGFGKLASAATAQTVAVQPGAAKSMTPQPAVVQPGAAKPIAPQPAVVQPAAAQPLVPQADAPQPGTPRAQSPAAGDVWILVTLSPGEWDRLAKNKPARVLPLATRDKLDGEVLARPSGLQPLEDVKRSMLTLYYVVPGKDHGLPLNNRMRVELQLAGSEDKQKVVPYGAVYYDGKGTAWVYVNPQPLIFERQRIGVERVVGDLAVLSSGPPVGTSVVTVGAALLYGAEIFGK